MRNWIIKKLGGYTSIEDALDAIRRTDPAKRNVLLGLAVKRLFNTIGSEDILKAGDGGEWLYEGKTLSRGQVELLKSEAKILEAMLLWKVIQKDIQYKVNRKLYLNAENLDHVVTAKFWLYTFDTIRTRIRSIATDSPIFNAVDK